MKDENFAKCKILIERYFKSLKSKQSKFIPGKSNIPLAIPPYDSDEVTESLESLMSMKVTGGKKVLKFENKWVIVLALTSNKGGLDFQTIKSENGKALFEEVVETSQKWGTAENMMYVVGATRAEQLTEIRNIIPNHFLLVPGVGVQGGNLREVAKYGMNADCGLLVNSSRGIIYAGNGIDFAEKARIEAEKLQQEMASLLSLKGI